MKNYIIGYGSLFKKSSLQRTLPEVHDILPIRFHNYLRSWNAFENKTQTLATTYLGLEKSDKHFINAIIFEVEQEMLSTIDKREFLYTRESVDLKDIEFLSSSIALSQEDKIWVYMTIEPSYPSSLHPIIESYVDTCISGCFEIEEAFGIENFAKEFIETTYNWSIHWVNDRLFPRAPHIHMPDAYKIDALLSKTVSEYFSKIEIE